MRSRWKIFGTLATLALGYLSFWWVLTPFLALEEGLGLDRLSRDQKIAEFFPLRLVRLTGLKSDMDVWGWKQMETMARLGVVLLAAVVLILVLLWRGHRESSQTKV